MTPRAYTAIFAVLVFSCGLVAGLMVDHIWEGHTVRAKTTTDSRQHVIEAVRQELSLTDDQSKQVDSILDEASKQFNSLHVQAHVVRQQSMDKIRAILTDQQRPKFEAAVNRLQKTIAAP